MKSASKRRTSTRAFFAAQAAIQCAPGIPENPAVCGRFEAPDLLATIDTAQSPMMLNVIILECSAEPLPCTLSLRLCLQANRARQVRIIPDVVRYCSTTQFAFCGAWRHQRCPCSLGKNSFSHSSNGHFDLCHQPAEFADAHSYGGMLVTSVIRMQKVGFDGEQSIETSPP